MNSLVVYESIGDLKQSMALDYIVHKPYWEQLIKGQDWHLRSRPDKYSNENEREEAIYKRVRT